MKLLNADYRTQWYPYFIPEIENFNWLALRNLHTIEILGFNKLV